MCADCYAGPDVIEEEGPTPYVIPRNWYRFGLKVPPRAMDKEMDVFSKWSVSFHGVKCQMVLKSVMQTGTLMKPGDRLLDGTVLGSTKCAGRYGQPCSMPYYCTRLTRGRVLMIRYERLKLCAFVV